jgi:hypothetical protein
MQLITAPWLEIPYLQQRVSTFWRDLETVSSRPTGGSSEDKVPSGLSQTMDAHYPLHLSTEVGLEDLPETTGTLEVESRVEDTDKKARLNFNFILLQIYWNNLYGVSLAKDMCPN